MPFDMVHVIPGDEITVTVKGMVLAPGDENPRGTSVKIYRPGYAFGGGPGRVNVQLVLDENAEVTYDVVSQFDNGVHRDANGRYWMRKAGGWYEMKVTDSPVPPVVGAEVFVPPEVRKLKADGDK